MSRTGHDVPRGLTLCPTEPANKRGCDGVIPAIHVDR
jgi:hypothetical protein